MNLFSKLQDQYDQLWKFIIRPSRSPYPLSHLGPDKFHLEGKTVQRVDFELTNPRGFVFFCSHFIPADLETYPCLIYLHGNSSNRVEGIEYLGKIIRNGISLCTFDFSGCGNAEGDYVTLGYYEQRDLALVVQNIRRNKSITKIALWGRSMGAVTALLYLRTVQDNEVVQAAIFDSPFKSLKSLVQDLCKKNTRIPSLILAGALKIIANTIEEKAHFSIYELNPYKNDVPHLTTPAMFIVGAEDQMIPPSHTQMLYAAYAGADKKLLEVKGKHNDPRSDDCVEQAVMFIIKHFTQTNYKDTKVCKKQVDILVLNAVSIQTPIKIDLLNKETEPKEKKQSFSLTKMFSNAFGKKTEYHTASKQSQPNRYDQSLRIIENRLNKFQIKKHQRKNAKIESELSRVETDEQSNIMKQIEYNMREWSYI